MAAGTALATPSAAPESVAVGDGVRLHRSGVQSFDSRRLKLAIVVLDLTSIAIAVALASFASSAFVSLRPFTWQPKHVVFGALSLPFWIAIFFVYRLYSANYISNRAGEFGRLVHAVGASVLGVASICFLAGLQLPPAWLPMMFTIATLLLAIEREAVRRALSRLRRRRRLVRRVVIVGANSDGVALAATLMAQESLGYEVLGMVGDWNAPEVAPAAPLLLGSLSEARDIVLASGASGVILVASAISSEISNRLARELSETGIRIEILPPLSGVDARRLNVRSVGRFSMVHVEPRSRGGWRARAKRLFDVAFSTCVLIVSAPLMAAIAVAIKADSRGPVLFRQQRVGQSGKTFNMLKFRSMIADAENRMSSLRQLNEADGPLFKMRQDPRVTRVGRVLRRWSFDELPQFWNVLTGDMTVVGPRPALASEINGWSPELHQRLRVKPGITGLWQVSGRSSANFEEYTLLDLYYVDNWSLLTDLSIVAKTLPTLLSRRGAW